MAETILPIKIGAREVDWAGARISARRVSDVCLFRLKQTKRDQEAAAPPLAMLPGVGASTELAAWLGPGEWLLFCSTSNRRELAEGLCAVQDEGRGYWTELSDALTVLSLDADTPIIAELTGLPLASLGPCRAARTRAAAIAMLFVVGADRRTLMIFESTFDRHVRAWLNVAT